ncbi:MAG: T9SS type A sorting domain-containing protein, partial [Cytophagales bacterium]|nr:T9SS type A sorting domain-containing protein [Cytophagales bacterium]
ATSTTVSTWTSIFNGNNTGNVKLSWVAWSFADKNESSALLIPGSCGSESWTNVSPAGTLIKNIVNSNPADNFTVCGTTLGIFNPEIAASKMITYPNPANDRICFQLEGKRMSKLLVFDVLGNKVMEEDNPRECIELNTELAPATYIIKVFYPDGSTDYSKFLKQ